MFYFCQQINSTTLMNKYFLIIIFLLGVLLQNCTNNEPADPNVFFCDAENTNLFDYEFLSHGNVFGLAGGATKREAYSGKQSCLLDTYNPKGMSCTITKPKPGEIFEVSVYRKSNNNIGGVILTSSNETVEKYQRISYGAKDANGWEYLSFNVQLPFNIDTNSTLNIYVFNRNKKGEVAYFDDLKIIRHNLKTNTLATADTSNEIRIQLLDQDYTALTAFRDKALEQEVISKELKQEFRGTLTHKNETFRIALRLKGDWTDHLTGYKWSYRIKILNKQAFLGLKTFSIQAPEVRSFLNEWVLHEICKKEDLLTTKYEFLPVNINGVNFGIYNLEEHFEKQLLESKKRREGPILKFSEDGFWERNLYLKNHEKEPNKPIYDAATILAFKQKKTLKTKKLNNQFLIAQNLMLNYKNGSPNIEDFMDIERLAQVYALMCIFNSDHAVTWHNQRLYYNPINSKLEFIVYDCFSGPGSEYARTCQIFGNSKPKVNIITNEMWYLIINGFDNPTFLNYYLKYLKLYSSTNYLDETLTELNPSIDSLTTMLRSDYENYRYDKSLLKSNAKIIRNLLPQYENKVKNKSIQYQLKTEVDTFCNDDIPFKNFSIKTHIENVGVNGKTKISILNYHCKPIKIIGYSTKIFPDSVLTIKQPITLSKYSKNNEPINTTLDYKPKKIFFKVLGTNSDSIYKRKVIKWPRPQLSIPYSNITSPNVSANSKIYSYQNDSLIFKAGKHVVKENIIIPKNLTVIFKPGTELIFNNNNFLLSYSALKMIGDKNNPIKITSTDKTAKGFTIIQAKNTSELNHVIFNGLNTFSSNGWELTGAVTFFESDVNISNSTFTNNNCEDGLNIVKSKFVLDNCTISNALLDGFDGDFCNGTVQNSHFNTTGNDCIDFSGSTISILNCDINNSGDKGISCGENSTVTIENVTITNAVIGIASKDQSTATIINLGLKNCEIGYSIFEKKAEYGAASVIVKNHTLTNVKTTSSCQEGSKFIIEQ
jgi:hypothetical protein